MQKANVNFLDIYFKYSSNYRICVSIINIEEKYGKIHKLCVYASKQITISPLEINETFQEFCSIKMLRIRKIIGSI